MCVVIFCLLDPFVYSFIETLLFYAGSMSCLGLCGSIFFVWSVYVGYNDNYVFVVDNYV